MRGLSVVVEICKANRNTLVFTAHLGIRVLTPLLIILPPVTPYMPVYKQSAIPLSCLGSRCGPLRQKCSILLLEPPLDPPFSFPYLSQWAS